MWFTAHTPPETVEAMADIIERASGVEVARKALSDAMSAEVAAGCSGVDEGITLLASQRDNTWLLVGQQKTAINELKAALTGMVESTERWNAAVQKIIGSQPETGIDLARAKDVLKKHGEDYHG